jgi:streptogramin lyase
MARRRPILFTVLFVAIAACSANNPPGVAPLSGSEPQHAANDRRPRSATMTVAVTKYQMPPDVDYPTLLGLTFAQGGIYYTYHSQAGSGTAWFDGQAWSDYQSLDSFADGPLSVDANGNLISFVTTGKGQAAVVRYNPGTRVLSRELLQGAFANDQIKAAAFDAHQRLWFLGVGGSPSFLQIGVVRNPGTPQQTVAQSAYRYPSNYVFRLAQGPDGNMWGMGQTGGAYSGPISMNVYRFDPTSMTVSTTYPVASTANDLGWLTLGPDGNEWFTEYREGVVGRITNAGSIARYRVPTSNYSGAQPAEIATGDDGALWLLYSSGSNGLPGIARVTTSGTVTEYSNSRLNGAGNLTRGIFSNVPVWVVGTSAPNVSFLARVSVSQ